MGSMGIVVWASLVVMWVVGEGFGSWDGRVCSGMRRGLGGCCDGEGGFDMFGCGICALHIFGTVMR